MSKVWNANTSTPVVTKTSQVRLLAQDVSTAARVPIYVDPVNLITDTSTLATQTALAAAIARIGALETRADALAAQVTALQSGSSTTPTTPTPAPAPTTINGVVLADNPFYEKAIGRWYTADSMWWATPVSPVLNATRVIQPVSGYYPAVGSGSYSTQAFVATSTDSSMTIYPSGSENGLIPDTGGVAVASITIPRWPASTVPAAGTDGHADVIDAVTGVIYSFQGLSQSGGRWTTANVGITRIDASGFGDPDNYYSGVRAGGVSTMGGVIRQSEYEATSDPYLKHGAVAISLDRTGFLSPTTLSDGSLSRGSCLVFPATNVDGDWESNYVGGASGIPMGGRMMLPASFDVTRLRSTFLQRFARTLQKFGAIVVDKNTNTPFVAYIENGFDSGSWYRGYSDWQAGGENGWSGKAADDLDLIRSSLQLCTGASSWLNADGNAFTPSTWLDLISMRAPKKGVYNPVTRFAEFDASLAGQTFACGNTAPVPIPWAQFAIDGRYRCSVAATGGAKFTLQIRNQNYSMAAQSGALGNGESFEFVWSGTLDKNGLPWLDSTATAGPSGASRVRATLVRIA